MEKHTLKQPKVFYFSVITSIFERHSYYVLGIVLTLFAKSVYGYSDKDAFMLFGLFTALGYVTPVIGGFISDNIIGIKRCMGFGLVLDFIGFLFLAIPNEIPYSLQISLALIVVGSGLFKTCPTNLLARGYEEKDPRIDGGFTLYYMGMNVGGFLASFTGSSYTIFGWHIPFAIAAIGLLGGIIWFFIFRHQGDDCEVQKGHEHFHMFKWIVMTLLAFLLVAIITLLLIYMLIGNILFYATCFAVFAYFAYEFIIGTVEDRKGILVCWILMFLALVGSLLYFQGFTSMELYMERCVNRSISGFTVPTVWFTSLNPIWIFILSPFLAILYRTLGEKDKDLTIPNKFALGILLIAIGFFRILPDFFEAS
jgi:proton-dependent oligopeptide transporter, POT family